MATKRISIPDHIKLKLWVLSGGRCEFPGCNKQVWRDDLTLSEDNFAQVAHIIGASPQGSRGSKALSSKLQIEYNNLMLLCAIHHKLIDGRNSKEYTDEQLREYKRKHEERIQWQTESGPEHATTVVRFESPIGDRQISVAALQDTYAALRPRYPADDKGVFLDHRRKAGRGDEAFWKGFADEVSAEVDRSFRLGNNERRHDHISVFAIGPIPILMHLGNRIGNIVPIDLYQKHRDTDDWKWKEEPARDEFEFKVTHTEGPDTTKVALILSLSGKNGPEMYRDIIGDAPVYEIEVEGANPGFLPYRSRLEKFRSAYRKVLSEIGAKYPGSAVHLFPAVPAPIAVLCGKELLPKSDPKVHVYDRDGGVFVPTLVIN